MQLTVDIERLKTMRPPLSVRWRLNNRFSANPPVVSITSSNHAKQYLSVSAGRTHLPRDTRWPAVGDGGGRRTAGKGDVRRRRWGGSAYLGVQCGSDVEIDARVRSVAALPNPAVPAYTELALRVTVGRGRIAASIRDTVRESWPSIEYLESYLPGIERVRAGDEF